MPKKVVKKVEPVSEVKPDVVKRDAFVYQVPEIREDFLALIQCLQDTGVRSAGELEVRASRL